MSSPSVHEMNMALCRTLGITDTSRVTEVTLVLTAGKWPQVLVLQMVPPTAGQEVAGALTAFELRPIGDNDAA